MKFLYGTPLARAQDDILEYLTEGNLEDIPKSLLKKFTGNNLYIGLSRWLCPSNLVVRDYAIRYVITQDAKYLDLILDQLTDLIVRDRFHANPLWAEGYSYFKYTKKALDLISTFNYITTSVEETFSKLQYVEDGESYVAPFGDCRKLILKTKNAVTDFNHPLVSITTGYNRTVWTFHKYNVMGNTHTSEGIFIVEGEDVVSFYEGHSKKYKNGFTATIDSFKRMIRGILERESF
jgi:hypothetical protein